MTLPRSSQISIDDTPWYHVVNRCVRRAYLCGKDPYTGVSYEHRRQWIEDRMMQLASVFCIDVAAFAVMSNHYHIVLHVDKTSAMGLSDDEVLSKWTQLFSGTLLVRQYLELVEQGKSVPDYLASAVEEVASVYRSRLFDVSWFMRVLNESVARMANKEDEVKGRFWEGRFKSQAIMDESVLMTVMAYVDLNPVRASIAEDLLSSDFTSVQCRIMGRYKHEQPAVLDAVDDESGLDEVGQSVNLFLSRLKALPFSRLLPFKSDSSVSSGAYVPFNLEGYIEFVDYMGRAVHPDKSGCIADSVPSIMDEMGVNSAIVDEFKDGGFLVKFGFAIGCQSGMKRVGASKGLGVSGVVFVADQICA